MFASIKEFILALKFFRELSFLGALDVKQRYRRSTLGPFWITIATGFNIFGLALVFGGVFQVPYEEYVPFLACGLVVWSYFTSSLTESADVLINEREAILERRVSLFKLSGRLVLRNVYISAHNFVIVLIVLLIFQKINLFGFVLGALGFLIVSLFVYFTSICISLVGVRFRDFSPILASMLQMLFYLTPIVWAPEVLIDRGRGVVVVVNPLYHLVEVIRAPLLGASVGPITFIVVLVMTLASAVVAFWMVETYNRRISYWV